MKSEKCVSSDFVLLFWDCFVYLGPFSLYINLRTVFSFLGKKKSYYNFIRDCIEYVDKFGYYWHINNVKFSCPWNEMFSHLLRFSIYWGFFKFLDYAFLCSLVSRICFSSVWFKFLSRYFILLYAIIKGTTFVFPFWIVHFYVFKKKKRKALIFACWIYTLLIFKIYLLVLGAFLWILWNILYLGICRGKQIVLLLPF